MRAVTILASACAALVTASSSALASSLPGSGSSSSRSLHQDDTLKMRRATSQHRNLVTKRDASTVMSGGSNNEGEDHDSLVVPDGAVFSSLPVGTGGEQLGVYWTEDPKNSSAKHAFVMIHGRLRNGNDYWEIMNGALQSALADDVDGARSSDIVTAPQFFSTVYNSGQYDSDQLAWDDVNGWQASDQATHPKHTNLTAFDALDAFVTEFSNTTRYPKMQNVTFVGHGGGGQLIGRYAQIAADPPSGLHVRYIAGDPSSNAYFTDDRPIIDDSIANKSSCPWYNYWRYGFSNTSFPYSPQAYFQRYVRRDVVSIVGYQDTEASGDDYCMAELQGGVARRDRNLVWYKLMNTLSGTDEDVSGFPGNFSSSFPVWNNMTGGAMSLRLIVVETADHNATLVFGGTEGRSALFSDGDLEIGWRPDGWTASTKGVTPGVTAVYGTNLMGSSSNSTTSTSSTASSGSTASSSSAASSTAKTDSDAANGAATTLPSLRVFQLALAMTTVACLVLTSFV